ncbi:AMP-binding protein [Dankookia sp. GCM10030260]|uniref:AMP-binding protein n=1 Tax=Dankookia sp. GCM10030260 TaxID=3273390 RepID=UPI0036068223
MLLDCAPPTAWIAAPVDAPRPEFPGRSLNQVLAALVARQPDHPAVVTATQVVTFAGLLGRVGTLAAAIRAAAAAPGPLALLLPNGPDYIAAVFAGIAAGRPVLVLEPAQPPARLAALLDAAGAGLVLHDGSQAAAAAGRHVLVPPAASAPQVLPAEPLTRHDPAFLFTTSGSSGMPKLVAHSQSTLMLLLLDYVGRSAITFADRLMLVGSHANYGPLVNVLAYLLAGATICQQDLRDDGAAQVFAAIRRHRVTTLRLVPSVFRMLARLPEAGPALAEVRRIRLGGEPVLRTDLLLAREVTDPRCRIENSYGATESMVIGWVSPPERLPDGAVVPAGTICRNAEYLLRDDAGDPVAPGRVGELVISSRGNALGDWDRGSIDTTRFPPDPRQPGNRLYATGDLARLLPDGNLLVLGRKDRMLKVNGQRVSPLEVESHLQAMPGCGGAAILPLEAKGTTRLIAFLVADPARGLPVDPAAWLGERLPRYMVPCRFERVAELPLLPGGKIDRLRLREWLDALPAASPPPAAGAPAHVTGLVGEMTRLWAEILGIPAPDATADFFALGGDSLGLVQLGAAIEHRFGCQLTTEALGGSITIGGLAALIAAGRIPAAEASPLVALQPLGSEAPFFCVHSIGGGFLHLRHLARHMGEERPFLVFRTRDGDSIAETVEQMAARYLRALRERQPHGPYLIGGYSFGAVVAYEMACQLLDQGEAIGLLAVLDARWPGWTPSWRTLPAAASLWLRNLPGFVADEAGHFTLPRLAGQVRRTLRGLGRRLARRQRDVASVLDLRLFDPRHHAMLDAHLRAQDRYRPRRRPMPIAVFRAAVQPVRGLAGDRALGWGTVAASGAMVDVVPGNHVSMIEEPRVAKLAAALACAIRCATRRPGPG